MPLPRFQTSLNDSFGAPGVYVQERAVQGPLRGIFRGTTGFVGECVRGPVNRVVLCPNYQRFKDVFGERDYGINGGTLRGQIWWALQGKSFGKLYIVRAAAAAAVLASFTLETAAGGGGTQVLRIDASSAGAWGNNLGWKVEAASDGNANHFNLRLRLYGKFKLIENLDISSTNDNTLAKLGADLDANWITLAKLAAGRPNNSAPSVDGADADGYTLLGQVVASYVSVAGTDGSIADADFTGAGKALETMHAARGVDSKLVAGRSNSAIKTKIFALAPTANLSAWLIAPDSESVSDTTWETEVASYRHRKVWPCFNHPYFIDPVTTSEVVGEPHVQMASDLSQIDYDVHPGVSETAELHNGITRLYNELTDAQRDALDAAGTSFLGKDLDENNNDVFLWGNGRTADLTNNNSQIDGERSKMFIIMGLAQRMRGDEKKPNTNLSRAKRKGAFEGWLTELAEQERIVKKDATTGRPLFSIKNGDEINTDADTAAGIQRDLVRIKMIPKNLYLQLQIEAGTDVVITEEEG